MKTIIFNIFVKKFLRSFVSLCNQRRCSKCPPSACSHALRRWHHWETALSIILWSIAAHTPDFIPPTLWTPNSVDLNLVDYKVWSVMQEQVNQTPFHYINDLKQRLFDVWATLHQKIIE